MVLDSNRMIDSFSYYIPINTIFLRKLVQLFIQLFDIKLFCDFYISSTASNMLYGLGVDYRLDCLNTSSTGRLLINIRVVLL